MTNSLLEIQRLRSDISDIELELEKLRTENDRIVKLSSSQKPFNPLVEISQIIHEKWGKHQILIYLLSENGNFLEKRQVYPELKEIFSEERVSIANSDHLCARIYRMPEKKQILFTHEDAISMVFPLKGYLDQVVFGVCQIDFSNPHFDLGMIENEKLQELIQILSYHLNHRCNSKKITLLRNENRLLYQLNQKLDISLSMDALIQMLEDQIQRLFHCDGYHISLLNQEKTKLAVHAIHLQKEFRQMAGIMSQSGIPLEKSQVNRRCIQEKQVFFLDQNNCTSFGENAESFFSYFKIAYSVFIPFGSMENNDSPIGVICLFNHDKPFSEKKVLEFRKELSLFYHPMKNASFFEELKEREKNILESAEKNRKILEMAERISKLNSIEIIYHHILETLSELFSFDAGFLFWSKNQLLEYAAGFSGKSAEAVFNKTHAFFKKQKGYEISLNDGATSACFLQNRFLYFSNIPAMRHLPMSFKDQEGINLLENPLTLVLLPIQVNKEPVGVIQLWSLGHFVKLSESDQALLDLLSSFIGTAVANAELYSLIEDQRKKLEEKNRIIEQKNTQLMDELKLARKIQENLIPSSLPDFQGIRIASMYQPMEDVGGDFYDFVKVRESDQLGIFISDVSGHGVPAALITSMVKTLVETSGPFRTRPSSMLAYMNEKITGQTGGNFLTAFYGVYDIHSRKFTYARGAHNPPYLVRNGEISSLKSAGKMLGILPGIRFEEQSLVLEPGDKILFYTDGLTESVNPEGLEFEPVLEKVLVQNQHLPAQEYLDALYRALLEHREDYKFEDDICIVALEILP